MLSVNYPFNKSLTFRNFCRYSYFRVCIISACTRSASYLYGVNVYTYCGKTYVCSYVKVVTFSCCNFCIFSVYPFYKSCAFRNFCRYGYFRIFIIRTCARSASYSYGVNVNNLSSKGYVCSCRKSITFSSRNFCVFSVYPFYKSCAFRNFCRYGYFRVFVIRACARSAIYRYGINVNKLCGEAYVSGYSKLIGFVSR